MSRAPVESGTGTVLVETCALQICATWSDPPRATVQVDGEIDLANADLLTAILDNHLALGRNDVQLDLSRLTFLDGTGLRAIVMAHDRFISDGGRLVLAGVGGRIAWLLRVTQLDEMLFVADRLDERPQPRRSPRRPEVGSSREQAGRV